MIASQRPHHQKARLIKDQLARYFIAFGGSSVILAIVLIFFYLLYVVIPLFHPASVAQTAQYPLLEQGETLHLAMEEQAEIGARFGTDGSVLFFSLKDGSTLQHHTLPLPKGTTITSVASADPATATVALGLSNGQALVVKHRYKVTFPNDQRQITPELVYPLGEAAITLSESGAAIQQLAFQNGEEASVFAAHSSDGETALISLQKESSFLDDSITLVRNAVSLPEASLPVQKLLLDKDMHELYLLSASGQLDYYDITDKEAVEKKQQLDLSAQGEISDVQFLTGGISLLIGRRDGQIQQWFPVRDEQGEMQLTHIRDFNQGESAIRALAPEFHRKGFLAIDQQGQLGIHHSTAHRTVLVETIGSDPLTQVAIAPRANATLIEDEKGLFHFIRIDNEHPEISWSSLWGKVWYESYGEPEYVWQSSSASNDFEPKFSLTPLSFGTLKAAFYAMLIAVPLSILGAIYTSQFMAPRMRKVVKPSIEIMEALPTVIIGFLAGLWLAPFIETQLAGIFTTLILLPVGIIALAYLWTHIVPEQYRNRIPDGWEGALLVPGIVILVWLTYSLGPLVEMLFFGGNTIHWLSHSMGIPFDQRNSLIVGFAMGFAIIPTIFSIAEDALFAVPKHLIQGSLALGATPWQTLVRVVLLTASPGIFSAVMIGMGRAVGETMIVLMATGNTPVMDMSIFQGMRTLSANIAVEMPESEVDSTHYRVLFLAALVLFAFTFIFNTLAEVIRQRLRRKYSSL